LPSLIVPRRPGGANGHFVRGSKFTGAKLQGAKELGRMFKTLGGRVQKKVARQAVNAGATPIAKAAAENAAEDSGALKLALKGGKRVKVYPESGVAVAVVGARKNVSTTVDGKLRKPSKYSHLVEGGHIAQDGTHVPAQPFLRPAYDANESKSLGIIKDRFAVGVVKEAKAALAEGGGK
jgi:HK97 gp10 family phage protein